MLWFVVNTDLTITTEKVNHLFSTLSDDTADTVGYELGLPYSKRSEIETNYRRPAQRREAYIDAYVDDHPCPSWKTIFNALHVVGLHDQADEVLGTYVQGTNNTDTVIVQLLYHTRLY